MEEENERQSAKVQNMRSKYQIGNANKGGAAFNIINLDYERSNEGNYLRQRDDAAKVRTLLRSKNIDSLGNAAYNLVSGEDRRRVEVPYHAYYNPPAGSNSSLSRVGAQVFGGGMAGRPVRGMEKHFGKRVASVNGSLTDQYNQGGGFAGSPQRTQSYLADLGPLDQPRKGMGTSMSMNQIGQGQQQKEPISSYGLGGAGTKFF